MTMQFIEKFKEYFPCMLRLDDGTEKPKPCWFIDISGNAHKLTHGTFSDMLQKLVRKYHYQMKLIDLEFLVAVVLPVGSDIEKKMLTFSRLWK